MSLLPWQQSQWNRLQALRQQRRIPHALLFQGPDGVGKRHFAEQFGRGLLCTQPDPSGLACGACATCLLLQAGNHPDLGWVEPEEEGKVIRIDQVREFIRTESLSSQAGGYKVRVITPADAMNVAAANALLKTLEEPTPSSLILLLSSRPGSLPATIRSRCQAITFPTPPAAQALAWLQGQGEQEWPALLAAAAGAPFKALALADPALQGQRREVLDQLCRLFTGAEEPIALAGAWYKRELPLVLGWLVSALVDLARLSANTACHDLFNPDLRDALLPLAQRRTGADWQRYLVAAYGVRGAIERQLNMQLQLESLLLLFLAGGEN